MTRSALALALALALLRACAATSTFAVTPNLGIKIDDDESSGDGGFTLCVFRRSTESDVVCLPRTSSISAGFWEGVDLEKFVYEGYSLRIGKTVNWHRSVRVNGDVRFEALTPSGFGRVTLDVALRRETSAMTSANVGTARKLLRSAGGLDLHIDVLATVVVEPVFSASHHAGPGVPAHDAFLHAAATDAVRVRLYSRLGNRLELRLVAPAAQRAFGFGERFEHVDQRGRSLYMWAEDGGWGVDGRRLPKTGATYMPVPFMHVRGKAAEDAGVGGGGYALWVNGTRRTDWDLDSSGAGHFAVTQEGPPGAEGTAMDAVVFAGPDPASNLGMFTALTGRALVPPPFQLGPWNRFRAPSGVGAHFDRPWWEDVRAFLIDRDIPSSVNDHGLHFLPEGPPSPGPARDALVAEVAQCADLGVPSLAYFNPMVSERSALFAQCREEGLFAMNGRGEPWTFLYKGAGWTPFKVGLIDFTHPNATRMYAQQLKEAIGIGFRGFMYDYGEYVDPHMRFHDGRLGEEVHNAYPVLYQRAAKALFTSSSADQGGNGGMVNGPSSPPRTLGLDPPPAPGYAPPYIFYVRSGFAGTAGTTWASWTGDPTASFDPKGEAGGLGAQIKAMLNAGLSGVPFTGSDIGGFVWLSPPSKELWLRWVQVGFASGIMRMQEGGTPLAGLAKTHVFQWEDGYRIYRRYAKMRTQLFPYLFTSSHDARTKGLPLMRHLVLSHAHDGEAAGVDDEWMLGPALLAAPVTTEGAVQRDVYLPSPSPSNSHSAGNGGVGGWYELGASVAYEEREGMVRIWGGRAHAGGQWLEAVDAPLDAMPLFVAAGTILPLLDPAVSTLDDTSHPLVTSMRDASHVLHAWVFPSYDDDERTRGKKGQEEGGGVRMAAEGGTWDGLRMRLKGSPSPPGKGKGKGKGGGGVQAVMVVQESEARAVGRALIVQVASGPCDALRGEEGAGGKGTWASLVAACDGSLRDWAWDPQQRTLWLCMHTGTNPRAIIRGTGCDG